MKTVKPLEQVLAENKKAIQEKNRRHQEYIKKQIEDQEKDQKLQRWILVLIVIILFAIFALLSSVTEKAMQDCISKKGVNYCERKLG